MILSATSLAAATAVVISAFVFQGKAEAQSGRASWYSMTSRTASGERCNPHSLTAAHRTLPFGTKVKVENLKNGRSVVVRINDRGPFIRGRMLDLSLAAAKQLGFIASGHTAVCVNKI